MKQIKSRAKILKAVFLFLAVTVYSFGQEKSKTDSIAEYLESTINFRSNLKISHTSQNIFPADIIESSLSFNPGQNSREIIQEQYFEKYDDKLTAYKTLNDMFSANEFIERIDFKLLTEEDGITFQSMLKLMDYERGLGFYRKENTWFFVRSKFFDEKEIYEVNTDQSGKIISIVYIKKSKQELADELLRIGENVTNDNAIRNTISEVDDAFMHQYLLDDLNYVFEVSPTGLNSVNKIATIAIHKCALKITDETAIIRTPFWLVINKDQFIKQASTERVLRMQLFIESLQEKYRINTAADAELFLNLLEELKLFKSTRNSIKNFYQKDEIWVFERKKRFDEVKGYVLKLDSEKRVLNLEYTTISEGNIQNFKAKESKSIDLSAIKEQVQKQN